MPAARLCSIAATILLALERLASRQVRAALRGNRAVAQHVEVALELRGEVLLEELPRSLGRASRWRCGCPCPSVRTYCTMTFLPAPMSRAHSSRIPSSAASSCSSVSMPPPK